MKYSLALKRNEVPKYAAPQMYLEKPYSKKKGQSQKAMCNMTAFVWHVQKGRNRETKVVCQKWLPAAWGRGKWEVPLMSVEIINML